MEQFAFGRGWIIDMIVLSRFARLLLVLAAVCILTVSAAFPQEPPAGYISPSHPVQRGRAPGLKVRLIIDVNGTKEYAVIFGKGDEVLSGLLDFADEYQVTSGHFTAIGALNGATVAWFDDQKKMFHEIPINTQVEVLSMIGDFSLYQGKPAVHTHMVVGDRDGKTTGGHVIEATVFPTLEVFVTVDPTPLHKKLDPETDLTLIEP